MKKELFINGMGCAKVEIKGRENIYCILDDDSEFYVRVSRNIFIDELKRLSWVCLTSWNKELRVQYLDMIDFVKELKD